ncbi:MAG: hypothetical protein K2M17_06235 [Bacilli bacterium]|nr:hypothetical protein [Bacilli bacterium]
MTGTEVTDEDVVMAVLKGDVSILMRKFNTVETLKTKYDEIICYETDLLENSLQDTLEQVAKLERKSNLSFDEISE